MSRPLPVLPSRPLPEPYRAALRHELMTAAREDAAGPSRRRRLYASTGAAVAIVAGGGAVAYSQLGSAPVTDHGQARCYTEARYTPGTSFPGTTIASGDYASKDGTITQSGGVRDALAGCAALFRQGFLQVGATRVPAIADPGPSADRPVPSLVECVLPDGTAAVFPGSGELCVELGLAAVDPGR